MSINNNQKPKRKRGPQAVQVYAVKEEKLLNNRELMEMTGLSYMTLYRLRKKGKIKYYKIGKTIYYKLSEVLTAQGEE